MQSPPLNRIAFFAHERGDARVVKRITALGDHGWGVVGFTFHREREKADVPPTWRNIHLGTTYNRRYVQRVCALFGSVGVLWKQRETLGECGVIYVINTDNALLALLGKFLAGSSAPLVLELADIQPMMTGGGMVSKIARMIERFVLRRTELLVTTSPGFVREYFQPVQKYRGEIFLLENKVYPSAMLPQAVSGEEPVAGGKPWVVGCFGAFRCRRSLQLMRELAIRLDGGVRFVLRGYPAGTLAVDFEELIGNSPNVTFGGAYKYPDDLAEMYRGIDFNWAFDESDPSGNSAWLLPNRIYEGGCFGVPAIAGKVTETGRWIEDNALGWTFDEPLEETLAAFFESLETESWQAVRQSCMNHPREKFVGDGDYAMLADRLRGCL
ncbi:MAG: glucosyl transferase [Gloeobacteraceae cyanobacterium ES-bin-144]|nr:glucosyl transferase [Verrucomicrobiales bacterium]